jgi:hypothetical protein
MRNVLDKICRENQNTHFMFNDFFLNENHAFFEKHAKDDNMISAEKMQFEHQIRKARIQTLTHNIKYLILLTAVQNTF